MKTEGNQNRVLKKELQVFKDQKYEKECQQAILKSVNKTCMSNVQIAESEL